MVSSAADDAPVGMPADGPRGGSGRATPVDLLAYDVSEPWRYKHDAAFDTNPRWGASFGEVEFFLQTYEFTEATFLTGLFNAPAGRSDLVFGAESTTDLATWLSDAFDVEYSEYPSEEHPGYYDTNKAYMTQKPSAAGQLRAVRFTFEYVAE